MKYQHDDQLFHLVMVIVIVVSFSCVTVNAQKDNQTIFPPPSKPCSGGKDVWNICWMNSPPYVFNNDPRNTTKVGGILIEVLNEGLKVCSCSSKMKFYRVDRLDDLLECSESINTDIVLPFPTKKAAHRKWLFSVVDSPNVYLLLNRETIESKAKERVLTEFLSVWTIAVLTVLLAFIFGIIVWFLDMFGNTEQFPPKFMPGSLEGVWWSFVTLTTVGYGDKTPKFPLARMFAVIWMFVGMAMISLLTATMTKTLTTAVFDKQNYIQSKTIGVLNDSYTYDEAVKKGAQPYVFSSLGEMFKTLDDPDNNKIDGILIDIFVSTYVKNNPEQFPLHSQLFVGESYDVVYPLSFYFGLGINKDFPFSDTHFSTCFSNTYQSVNKKIDVYRIVEKYIQSVGHSNSIKQGQIQLEMNLFSSTEAAFLSGVKILSAVLGVLIFLGIIWQITHWKQSKTKSFTNGVKARDVESINMTPHHHRDTTNIKILMDKLNEVDDALNKLTEFKELLETYKREAKRYDSGIINGITHNGTTNSAYIT